MANETMLPQLIGGSVVMLPIGSAFVSKIQECFQQHMADHPEELKALTARQGKYDDTPLTPWENQAVMYSTLLQGIMKQAEKDGQIEYVPLDSVIKASMPKTTPSDQKEDSDQPE